MTEEYGDEYNSPDGLVVEFEINRDSYIAEAKLVFEEKINNGEIKIDVNHDGTNITVIYPSGDPLYNLTKNLGYEVEIPGANIVYVEYGLNKLYEFGKGGGNILSFDLHAAHTGNVSAVDYNSDGKIDDFEENLGLYIDDVIPRSVFTGREIGSNTIGGEVLEMSSEHMNNFTDYLKMLHQNYMPGVIDRNTLENSNNEDKIADSSTFKTNFCEKIVSDIVNSTENLVKYIDSSTGFVNNIILKGIDANLNIRLALTGTNGKSLPKTENFWKQHAIL